MPVLSDPRVSRLRLYRNGCFHYQRDYRKQVQFHEGELDGMNWAESLHAELGDFFKAYCATETRRRRDRS